MQAILRTISGRKRLVLDRACMPSAQNAICIVIGTLVSRSARFVFGCSGSNAEGGSGFDTISDVLDVPGLLDRTDRQMKFAKDAGQKWYVHES